MVSPPPSSPRVVEDDLPADVRGWDLEVLTLAQDRSGEAVLVAGVEVVLTGVVQDGGGALHLGQAAGISHYSVQATNIRCRCHQRGRHRAKIASLAREYM